MHVFSPFLIAVNVDSPIISVSFAPSVDVKIHLAFASHSPSELLKDVDTEDNDACTRNHHAVSQGSETLAKDSS